MPKRRINYFAWDKKLDYEKERARISRLIRETRQKRGVLYQRRLVMLCVLLTQLANGARVSEAYDAVRLFAETRRREVEIFARKSGLHRTLYIPPEIYDSDIPVIRAHIDKISIGSIKMFCKRNLGYNTHALRYAFISYMAREGVSPQLIAKMTGHRKLDYILYYTQEVDAKKILKRYAMGKKR